MSRIVHKIPLLRSFSDTFLHKIEDLDKLESLKNSQTLQIESSKCDYVSQVSCASALNLCSCEAQGPPVSTSDYENLPILLPDMPSLGDLQIVYLLFLASVSILSMGHRKIVIDVSSAKELSPFQRILDHLVENNINCGCLISCIIEYVENENSGTDIFTFIENKSTK